MIYLPLERPSERMDFDAIYSKISDLRRRGKQLKCVDVPMGRGGAGSHPEVEGEGFKLLFFPYKVEVHWDPTFPGSLREACLILRECLDLECERIILVEPDYIRGAECWEDLGFARGKIVYLGPKNK